jgi:DNA-binding transcriptional MerR regulator
LISVEKALPPIPAKRYFTIGEVSELCGVKPYVLRYWEQEFTQLKPMKRRGNRRYYQHHEVLLVRRIRELLYDQGFTISGARNRLGEMSGRGGKGTGAALAAADLPPDEALDEDGTDPTPDDVSAPDGGATAPVQIGADAVAAAPARHPAAAAHADTATLRRELLALRELLTE